jgi:hypothetical protein
MEILIDNNVGVPRVYPKDTKWNGENLLKVVYYKGPVEISWPLFDDIKKEINRQMAFMPKQADVISTQMKYKIASLVK